MRVRELIIAEPRPCPSCHASTVLPLDDGRVLAAWFGGSREGAADVGVYLACREQGGWRAPVRLSQQEGTPHWNPVLAQRAGEIWLFYKVGYAIAGWRTWVRRSRDGGRTWGSAYELVPGDIGGRGPVKNKPIALADGAWLAGASTERGAWLPMADLSLDGGASWSAALVPAPEGVGLIQPTLWQDAMGETHMLLRSNAGRIYRSDAPDGRSWCQAYPTALANNNSGIDLDRDDAGNLYLAYNPVSGDWVARTPLALARSRDNGRSWQTVATLAEGPGEYSYPAVAVRGDTLHVTYTYRRENIAYDRFDLREWEG